MAILLKPETQAKIAEILEDSQYPDADALVSDALSALAAQRQLDHLSALLEVGIDQADRGESIPFTEELWEEMRESARKRFAAGERAASHVRP